MKLTRVTLATASSVLLVATLAACGGSGSDDTANDAGPATEQQDTRDGGPGGRPGGAGFPGASGKVAAVSGRTAQVQSQQSGQVAVGWAKDTTFTEQVDGTLDDVTVGSCVVVTTADDSADHSADHSADLEAAEVAAATVRVSEANDDGGCGFAVRGRPGGPSDDERPEGAPTGRPSDLPSDVPSGAPEGGRSGGFGRIGEVTAVSADGFTISATMPGRDDATEVTVTVDADTTYTTNAAATASAVKVGRCMTARGEADDTGAVTAETISVSEPVDGECTGGFGELRMGGPEGGAA